MTWHDESHVTAFGLLCTILMAVALFLMAVNMAHAEDTATHTFVVMRMQTDGYAWPIEEAKVSVKMKSIGREWHETTVNGVVRVALPVGYAYEAWVTPPDTGRSDPMGKPTCFLLKGYNQAWSGDVTDDQHHLTVYIGGCGDMLLAE